MRRDAVGGQLMSLAFLLLDGEEGGRGSCTYKVLFFKWGVDSRNSLTEFVCLTQRPAQNTSRQIAQLVGWLVSCWMFTS